MAFIYAMVDEWNDNSVDFNAIRMSVTNTTSGAGSLLMNLIVNGVSVFTVSADGTLRIGTAGFISPDFAWAISGGLIADYTSIIGIGSPRLGLALASSGYVSWTDANQDGTRDTAFKRAASGIIELNTGTTASYAHLVLFTNRTVGVTFASLPGVASVSVGGRAMITNSTTATFNATAAGGGANVVPVFSDGTQWKVG